MATQPKSRLLSWAATEIMRFWLTSALLILIFFATFRYRPYHFPDGDSLYHLGHRVTDLQGLIQALTEKQDIWYRPISNNIACGLLTALLGLNLVTLNHVPMLVHLVNVLLLNALLLRLGSGRLAAFGATVFFLTHHVAGRVSRDLAFLPELFITAFLLTGMHLILSFARVRRWSRLVGLIVVTLLAFGSKESGLIVALILLIANSFQGVLRFQPQAAPSHVPVIFALGVPMLLHSIFLLHLSPGSFDSYFLEFSPGLLGNNLSFYLQRLLLPARSWSVMSALAALAFALSALFYRPKLSLLGAMWTLLGLAPVLLLHGSREHYLYLPVVGCTLILAGAMAGLMDHFKARSAKGLAAAALATLLAVIAAINGMTTYRDSRELTTSQDSIRGWRIYQSLRESVGILPSDHLVYVLNQPQKGFFFDTGRGGLLNVVSGIPPEQVLYAEVGAGVPTDFRDNPLFHAVTISEEGEARDETLHFKATVPPVPKNQRFTGPAFEVQPRVLVRMKDKLEVRLQGCDGSTVGIKYRINDGTVRTARTWLHLDRFGRARLTIGANIRPVRIRITAFNCVHWQPFVSQSKKVYNFRFEESQQDWIPTNLVIDIIG